jgi:predicted nucleic-acid-binding protein
MKTYFIDTNVILRFLLKDNDELFNQSLTLFEKAKNKQIKVVIIPEIFFELDYVLRGVYALSKKEVVNLLKVIAQTPYFAIKKREVIIEALDKYEQLNIDLFDLYLFLLAKNKNAEVFSFDKDFKKIK